jgi:hypothetical protein
VFPPSGVLRSHGRLTHRLRCPQLSFQFYELGLEFHDGVCDDAGGQGCARGRGGRASGARTIDVLKSAKHAPRNICLRRHVLDTKVVKCFKYWVAKRHCRLLLRFVIFGGVRSGPLDCGPRWSPSAAPPSYRAAPPSESQRSCGSCLGAGFAVWPDGHEADDGRVVAAARRGHHGGVCVVGIGVGRDYQQNDPAAVEPEDFDGVGRLVPESAPVAPFARRWRIWRGRCPFVQVIAHAVNGPEPHRQHRQQVRKLP